jgi:response regulator RpfG family c-di-GMP phosphodiesterase
MAVILEQAVKQYRLVNAERELLDKTLRGAVRMLIEILASLNPELFGRAQQLRLDMRQMSDLLGLSDNWSLELAALLAQIGVVTLPLYLIQRQDKGLTLSAEEQAILDRMPEISYKLLANIPRLEPVALIIRYQTKNFDGSGLPNDEVATEAIPIGSRILKVLLDLRQMESRGASPIGAYMLMRNRREIYDPLVIDALGKLYGQAADAPHCRPPVNIKLAQLKIGHVLAANLETDDGKMLIGVGRQITETLLEKILNYSEITVIREPIVIESPAGMITAPPPQAHFFRNAA